MVTHQPKDGNPPSGIVLQTWNLALTKLTLSDNGNGWLPTILWVVTHQPRRKFTTDMEFNSQILTSGDNCHGWSSVVLGSPPTYPRMVNQKEGVYYRLSIWYLDLTHKIRQCRGNFEIALKLLQYYFKNTLS